MVLNNFLIFQHLQHFCMHIFEIVQMNDEPMYKPRYKKRRKNTSEKLKFFANKNQFESQNSLNICMYI